MLDADMMFLVHNDKLRSEEIALQGTLTLNAPLSPVESA